MIFNEFFPYSSLVTWYQSLELEFAPKRQFLEKFQKNLTQPATISSQWPLDRARWSLVYLPEEETPTFDHLHVHALPCMTFLLRVVPHALVRESTCSHLQQPTFPLDITCHQPTSPVRPVTMLSPFCVRWPFFPTVSWFFGDSVVTMGGGWFVGPKSN